MLGMMCVSLGSVGLGCVSCIVSVSTTFAVLGVVINDSYTVTNEVMYVTTLDVTLLQFLYPLLTYKAFSSNTEFVQDKVDHLVYSAH